MLDLIFYLSRISRWQVDLVDDWYDLKVIFKCDIDVCDGLRLHALRSIHDEQRALATSQRAAHLVAKINVSWGVYQI